VQIKNAFVQLRFEKICFHVQKTAFVHVRRFFELSTCAFEKHICASPKAAIRGVARGLEWNKHNWTLFCMTCLMSRTCSSAQGNVHQKTLFPFYFT
jgi:hypothetical protein